MCASFFGNFFKKEVQSVNTTLEDVPRLIEKEFLIQKNDLEEYCAKAIAQLKYEHSRANGLLSVIDEKELEGKPNERLNRAAITAKKQLIVQLSRLLAKLDPKERGNNIDDARKFSGEGYALLINEINAIRKNIAFTSFYHKEEMKTLGETLQAMVNTFHEMNTEFAKSTGLFEFEKIKNIIKEIKNKKSELRKSIFEIKELNAKILSKESEVVEKKEKLTQRKSGSEMNRIRSAEDEMTALMSKKQELRTEISALLLNIDRPLARFKQLVDSSRWKLPKEEKEMLDLFIVNPMLALKKDPKADLFKKVLGEIVSAIEEGKIELKDKEKEKRMSALQEIINFDFFGGVFWKMNEIQKKQDELNKHLANSDTKKEITAEEEKIFNIEKDVQKIKEEITQKEKLLENAKKEIEQSTERVRLFAAESLKKNIILEESD